MIVIMLSVLNRAQRCGWPGGRSYRLVTAGEADGNED